ncbi:Uncharacterized protein DAT39_003246 [Clarias magur]|uniref:Uncharacterized protein n=1 Tax=Clarias magur TaxID=1594786 RepID=A0A8J4U8B4_CLAMG|nr:Uncharacterized protein DAT39_003246 [Clarias magur]
MLTLCTPTEVLLSHGQGPELPMWHNTRCHLLMILALSEHQPMNTWSFESTAE